MRVAFNRLDLNVHAKSLKHFYRDTSEPPATVSILTWQTLIMWIHLSCTTSAKFLFDIGIACVSPIILLKLTKFLSSERNSQAPRFFWRSVVALSTTSRAQISCLNIYKYIRGISCNTIIYRSMLTQIFFSWKTILISFFHTSYIHIEGVAIK